MDAQQESSFAIGVLITGGATADFSKVFSCNAERGGEKTCDAVRQFVMTNRVEGFVRRIAEIAV